MNSILEDIQQIFNEQPYIEESGKEEFSKETIEDDMDQFVVEFQQDNGALRFSWDDTKEGVLNIYAREDITSDWESISIAFPHLQNQ